jgi:hypothetical protein
MLRDIQMVKGEILNIRVELRGEIRRKFEQIKKDLGLENNTEVLRSLIERHSKFLTEKHVAEVPAR